MAQPAVTHHATRRRYGLFVGVLFIAALSVLGVFQITRSPLTGDNRIYSDLAAIELVAINLYDPNTGASETLNRSAEGIWTLEGFDGPVDRALVNQIAQTLVLLSYTEVITLESNDSLEAYGFNPLGRLFVEFLEADGTQHAVGVGDLLPDRTQGFYALVDDRPDLYVIPRGAVDFLISQLQGSLNTN